MNHDNKEIFKFPRYLPNDLEGFIDFYPGKFPGVVPYYEKCARKYFKSPEKFKVFAEDSYKDLVIGVNIIRKDYSKGDKNDLDFLLETDNRLHKLYAFRFWIVNYLFADGPFHEHYIDMIKSYGRLAIGSHNLDTHDYEKKVLEVERNLIQSDYKDLYLRFALNGVILMRSLRKDKELSIIIGEVSLLIKKENPEKNNSLIYKKLDKIIDNIDENLLDKDLIIQSEFRKSKLPIYNMIIHSIEFEKENRDLQKRQDKLQENIHDILSTIKQKCSKDEFEELKISYKMASILSESKDIMGNIDQEFLPLWFDIIGKIAEILENMNTGYKQRQIGPGALFYAFSWYLPDKYKARIFTPDIKPFDISKV
ncbi:MAG: hypothetical protein KAI67_01450 [Candidatus Pacebacteria bacterium]|nr:hypothetical protein [Candidatus Paceibacterota bacterium]